MIVNLSDGKVLKFDRETTELEFGEGGTLQITESTGDIRVFAPHAWYSATSNFKELAE